MVGCRSSSLRMHSSICATILCLSSCDNSIHTCATHSPGPPLLSLLAFAIALYTWAASFLGACLLFVAASALHLSGLADSRARRSVIRKTGRIFVLRKTAQPVLRLMKYRQWQAFHRKPPVFGHCLRPAWTHRWESRRRWERLRRIRSQKPGSGANIQQGTQRFIGGFNDLSRGLDAALV